MEDFIRPGYNADRVVYGRIYLTRRQRDSRCVWKTLLDQETTRIALCMKDFIRPRDNADRVVYGRPGDNADPAVKSLQKAIAGTTS